MKLLEEDKRAKQEYYNTLAVKLQPRKQKPLLTNSQSLTTEPIKDKACLEKAYGRESKVYMNGDTLYIAGTSSIQDIWDDLKIPFNQTAKSLRYRNAAAALKANKDIVNVVGHSLGGSVALELQKNMPERNFKSNTYGAPVLSMTPADNRFRNYFDPVSFLDQGAVNSVNVGLNPHTFSNYDKNKVSTTAFKSYAYKADE